MPFNKRGKYNLGEGLGGGGAICRVGVRNSDSPPRRLILTLHDTKTQVLTHRLERKGREQICKVKVFVKKRKSQINVKVF